MQSVPARVRQTLATKLSALEFGLAARQAKMIREVFHNVYEMYDGSMVRRLTVAVAASLRASEAEAGHRDLHNADADLSQLKGFNFNVNALFERLVAAVPRLDVAPEGSIRFRLGPFIPADDIVYPVELFRPNGSFNLFVAAFDFRNGHVRIIDCKGFDFAKSAHTPAEIDWLCDKPLPEGNILFVVLTLRYFSLNWLEQRVQTTNQEFYPSIILDAFHVTDQMRETDLSGAEVIPLSEDTRSALQKIVRLKAKTKK